jgi:hypothetical protein
LASSSITFFECQKTDMRLIAVGASTRVIEQFHLTNSARSFRQRGRREAGRDSMTMCSDQLQFAIMAR